MAARETALTIPVDGERLDATLVTPGTLMPGVLFVHGWGGSQAQYLARARAVAGLGCVCLAFDLRGHAETKRLYETVSRDSNLADVLAAYDLLVRQPWVDPQAVAVIGSSYGGYLAAILTTLRPVRWLGLRAPALYMDSGWDVPKLRLRQEQDLPAYRSKLIAPEDNRALRACQDFEGDVLLVQSEHDAIIHESVIKSYRGAAVGARSLTFRCLKGADHGLTQEGAQQAYTTVLVKWLQEMVEHSRHGPVTTPASEPGTAPEGPPLTLHKQAPGGRPAARGPARG